MTYPNINKQTGPEGENYLDYASTQIQQDMEISVTGCYC